MELTKHGLDCIKISEYSFRPRQDAEKEIFEIFLLVVDDRLAVWKV